MRGLIAVTVVVILVLAVVLMGRSSARPAVEKPGATGTGPTQGVTALFPVKIVLECEEPATLEDKLPDGTVIWKQGQMTVGAVVKYLESPDGWIDEWVKGNPTERKVLKGKPGALPGKGSYVFDAPRDDTYYVNLRAKWYDDCGNSVWVKVDDSPWFELEDQNGQIGEKNYKWAWHQLYVRGHPKGFELKKGQHALWMDTREDGPRLDQWVVSTDANPPIGEAVQKK